MILPPQSRLINPCALHWHHSLTNLIIRSWLHQHVLQVFVCLFVCHWRIRKLGSSVCFFKTRFEIKDQSQIRPKLCEENIPQATAIFFFKIILFCPKKQEDNFLWPNNKNIYSIICKQKSLKFRKRSGSVCFMQFRCIWPSLPTVLFFMVEKLRGCKMRIWK